MNKEFNPDLKDIFKTFSIPYEEGLLCLLGFFHNIQNIDLILSKELVLKVLATGIVTKNDNIYIWNTPLFYTMETNFTWITDFRNAFKKINPDRISSIDTCLIRMKKFFIENPSVRVDDIRGATKMYLNSVKDPQYLMKPHKFIYDGAGANKNSTLKAWLDLWYEAQEKKERTTHINTMQ